MPASSPTFFRDCEYSSIEWDTCSTSSHKYSDCSYLAPEIAYYVLIMNKLSVAVSHHLISSPVCGKLQNKASASNHVIKKEEPWVWA